MRVSIIVGLVACLGLGACGQGDDPGPTGSASGDGGRLVVVAGFYPIAEAAQQIGGEAVEVVNLTPAGAEAHDLELTTGQVDAVLDADLVLMLGRGFQPALEAAVEGRDGPTLDLLEDSAPGDESSAAEESAGAEGSDDHGDDGHDHSEEPAALGQADPHVWLDPRQFSDIAHEIGERIAVLAPGPTRRAIEERAEAYEVALKQLDLDFEAGLKRCQRREIVTTHAAFGHLASAYGLRQEAISGLSPEAEPEPSRLDELAQFVRNSGATTIFVEPLGPSDAAEVLARESGAATRVLHPLESLTRSEADSGATYDSVMRTNLKNLREALECH